MTRIFYGSNRSQPQSNYRSRPDFTRPASQHGPWRNFDSRRRNGNENFSHPRTAYRGHFQKPRGNGPRELKIPSELFPITKMHFVIVKCVHHKSNLADGFPPSLARKKDLLSNSVNPAFKNDFFKAQMELISNEWSTAVHEAMVRHYTTLLGDAMDFISENEMSSTYLEKSIQLVIKWARSQLGKKLKDSSLDEALTIIHDNQSMKEEAPQNSHRSPTPTATPFWPTVAEQTSQHSSLAVKELFDRGTQTFSEPSSSPTPASSPVPVVSTAPGVVSGTSTADFLDDARLSAPNSSHEVDLDLFSTHSMVQTTLIDANSFSTKEATSETPFDLSKPIIVLGDSNLKGLDLEDASVFSTEKGRLSYFKQQLQSIRVVHEGVRDFLLCLSSLDEKNKPSTNYVTFRALMSNAKRIFPNAKLSVLLHIIPNNASGDIRKDCKEFHDLISSKSPAGCKVVSTPNGLSVKANTWETSEKDTIFKIVKDFL